MDIKEFESFGFFLTEPVMPEKKKIE